MDAGKIKNVCETFTDGWKPDNAQKNMEQCLTSNDNKVDAVVSENDGMAGGVVAALDAQGLAGSVPVSGQDGDKAALNRVALGTQTVSIWKDCRVLGKAAGEAAVALAEGTDIDSAAGRRQVQRGQEGRRDELHPAHPGSDHQGHARPRDRRRLDQQGRGLRRRQGGDGQGLRLICLPDVTQLEPSWPRHPQGWRGLFVSATGKQKDRGKRSGRKGTMSTTSVTESQGPALSEEGAITRFLRATEIDTRMLGMVAALLVIWVGFDIYSGMVRPGEGLFGGSFLTPRNIWILLVQTSSIAVMTTGMVLVIVMRQIDLSVGSMLSLIAVSTGYAAGLQARPRARRRPPGDLDHRRRCSRIALGALIGCFNGVLIAYAGIPSFIVTLGGLIAYSGMRLVGDPRRDRGADGPDLQADRRQRAAGLDRPDLELDCWPSLACVGIVAAIISGRRAAPALQVPAATDLGRDVFLSVVGSVAVLLVHLGGQFLSVGAEGHRELRHGQRHPHSRRACEHGRRRDLHGGRQGRALRRGAGLLHRLRHPGADRAWQSGFLMTFLATRTRFGRYVYATGGNPEAAELAGINTKRLTVMVFTLMGVSRARSRRSSRRRASTPRPTRSASSTNST